MPKPKPAPQIPDLHLWQTKCRPFLFPPPFPFSFLQNKNKIPTISKLKTRVRNLLLSHSSLYLQWSKKPNHCFEVHFFSSFFIFLIVSPSASGLKSLSQLKFSVFNFFGPNSTKPVSDFSTFKAFNRRRREEMQWILLWAKENKNKEKMKGMTGRYRGHCERKKKKPSKASFSSSSHRSWKSLGFFI